MFQDHYGPGPLGPYGPGPLGPYGPGPLGPYGPGPLTILKNILSQICSRTIFEINTAPGACLLAYMLLEQYAFQILFKYSPGPYLKSTLLQVHVCYMLLEQYAFQIWSWSIFKQYLKSILLHPGAYSKHTPGAVLISVVLEHI